MLIPPSGCNYEKKMFAAENIGSMKFLLLPTVCLLWWGSYQCCISLEEQSMVFLHEAPVLLRDLKQTSNFTLSFFSTSQLINISKEWCGNCGSHRSGSLCLADSELSSPKVLSFGHFLWCMLCWGVSTDTAGLCIAAGQSLCSWESLTPLVQLHGPKYLAWSRTSPSMGRG